MRKILLPILLLACALIAFPAEGQYKFYDGNDWARVNAKPYSKDVMNSVKAMMLKAAQDASFLSGAPILKWTDMDTAPYIVPIDDFYSDSVNLGIPLFFALKIVDMERQNAPRQQIDAYRQAIIQKMGIL